MEDATFWFIGNAASTASGTVGVGSSNNVPTFRPDRRGVEDQFEHRKPDDAREYAEHDTVAGTSDRGVAGVGHVVIGEQHEFGDDHIRIEQGRAVLIDLRTGAGGAGRFGDDPSILYENIRT